MISLHESIKCGLGQSMLISLNSFEFPMSFYTTDFTNNSMAVWEDNVANLVGVQKGNYDIREFMDQFVSDWTYGSPNGIVYTYTYSLITNKITIIANNALGHTISIINSVS